MNDREVADYLLANPEFFSRHAELLAAVRLANPHGKAAISLQERQTDMLREKNKVLERRLAELLRYGHENDGLAAKFNRWTAHVMAERDTHALARTVTQGLTEVFDVPSAALRLWDVAQSYAQAEFARHVGEEVRIFANSLGAPYCGANTGFEAAQWLAAGAHSRGGDQATDDTAGKFESVVLIALRDPQAGVLNASEAANKNASGNASANPSGNGATFGLLVMGSSDPRRFHDGMATDFLIQIGTLASAALSRLLAR